MLKQTVWAYSFVCKINGYLEQFLKKKKAPPPYSFQETRTLNMFLFLLGLKP